MHEDTERSFEEDEEEAETIKRGETQLDDDRGKEYVSFGRSEIFIFNKNRT